MQLLGTGSHCHTPMFIVPNGQSWMIQSVLWGNIQLCPLRLLLHVKAGTARKSCKVQTQVGCTYVRRGRGLRRLFGPWKVPFKYFLRSDCPPFAFFSLHLFLNGEVSSDPYLWFLATVSTHLPGKLGAVVFEHIQHMVIGGFKVLYALHPPAP